MHVLTDHDTELAIAITTPQGWRHAVRMTDWCAAADQESVTAQMAERLTNWLVARARVASCHDRLHAILAVNAAPLE